MSLAEAPGREARGAAAPPIVLQDHFSSSSNSGVKIVRGVGPKILAVLMSMDVGLYNLSISIAFSHDLYGIDSVA